MMRSFAISLVLLLSFARLSVVAQEQAPLQANIRVRVDYNEKRAISFQSGLGGGVATVKGSVVNLPGGETALVLLHFDYRTDAAIALDELISQIFISIRDAAGNEISRVTIDPNTAPLNPNRAPLYYSATLYKPPAHGRNVYIARIKVFGNYE